MKGEYIYNCNGERVDIVETFEIDGNQICSERRAFGVTLRVAALVNIEDDRVVRFEVEYGEDVSAQYQVQADGVLAEYVRAGERSVEQKQITGRFEPFPLMRIFMGRVIRQIESLGGQDIQIMVPWIFDPADERFLSIHVDKRSAKKLDEGLYQYIGENYDADARFWVDARGILTRYTWKQGEKFWDVELRTTADD